MLIAQAHGMQCLRYGFLTAVVAANLASQQPAVRMGGYAVDHRAKAPLVSVEHGGHSWG